MSWFAVNGVFTDPTMPPLWTHQFHVQNEENVVPFMIAYDNNNIRICCATIK